ncbi:hypothetical protein HanHA300_Chr10g0351691 [Helianthus annuus]|nr:hypothetical protein HanHA300_Chr10g0351691 [Helianthus annuus]KAJ0529053.1 hypothetical protein HanHA89_Chr10g0373371 [Helianthus annuus]
MSHTGRSIIRSVLTAKDLESFVDTYKKPKRFSPTLPNPDESAECTPDQIILYTLAFSSCGVRYPLSSFKIALLRHFGVHFSQLHPLGFMRVVHFELSCMAVSGESSVPLFCMFYKLISDGDWFTFAKRKNSVSQSCYSFMPTSTYPKEWKSRFIFVSAAMITESPPLRDVEAPIEDRIPTLSADEIVQWKRMYENPTRAFTFSEGILAMGGLSPSYSVRPKAFFGKKELTLWRLLQGDSRDVKFVVGDDVELGLNRGVEMQVTRGSVQAGGPVAVEEGGGTSSDGEESSLDPLQVEHSDHDDEEDLESRLARKRKAISPKPVPAPRDIRLRLRSASGQKAPPATKAASELPPIGVKGSLSKHLRSSSFVSEPLLGSSHAPIEIPTATSSSRVRDKTPEVHAARITPAFEVSPHHATGTSKPSHFEGFTSRSPLAPLFADALPAPYVPKWKITPSSVVGNPETARDFLTHVVPPSYKFMNSALRDDLFDDQYSMSLCEGLFRGVGMLQRVNDLRQENEGLKSDLKASQSIASELRCQVVEAEHKLQEEKGAGAMLEWRERAWEREMAALVEENEELAAELKHQKELDSVSQKDLDVMYAEYGVTSDDNQRLAKEKHWLITEGFGAFLTAVSQSEEFKSGLELVYRAYRDVGYQSGLKDGYIYSAQGLDRKETPLYNSKAKKRLSKLDKEFGGKTPALLEKILEHPMISIDELKALFAPAGPSSPKSLSGGGSQSFCQGSSWHFPEDF